MEIPFEIHPFEIQRKLSLIADNFLGDLDLRFPETRKRFALKLKLSLSAEDQNIFDNLIQRFHRARRAISFLDWGLLIEWNERLLQAECLAEISSELNKIELTPSDQLAHQMFERLEDIADQIRTRTLKENPGFFQSFRFRWYFSPVRDEASYLLTRLTDLKRAA